MTIEIKSPLQYFPINIGEAKLVKTAENSFDLYFQNELWMGYENTHWQAGEFVIELASAYGKCVTSGLGLGIIQTLLSLNPLVTEVVVYEKHQDIIDMFKVFASRSNFDTSKIKIICQDADTIKDISCDCLFLDHFEFESDEDIIRRVKNIAEYNTANFVWFWRAGHIYIEHTSLNNIEINNESFYKWSTSLEIKSFPVEVSLELIEELKMLYKTEAFYSMGKVINNLDSRNTLLNIFKKGKNGKING
jgi:hypothetical protein